MMTWPGYSEPDPASRPSDGTKNASSSGMALNAKIHQNARELFVADGFDRTSMDAVAMRAKVSKRTVYDYYGDKRTLLIAVLDDVRQSLLDSLIGAIDANLSDVSGIRSAANLEAALVAFCLQVTSSTMSSSDYTDVRPS